MKNGLWTKVLAVLLSVLLVAALAGCSAAKRCVPGVFSGGFSPEFCIFWRSLRHPFCCATGRYQSFPGYFRYWPAARQEAWQEEF